MEILKMYHFNTTIVYDILIITSIKLDFVESSTYAYSYQNTWIYRAVLLYKAKRQYLLFLQSKQICVLALHISCDPTYISFKRSPLIIILLI